MAIFYPPYESISQMTVAPTEGERALLDFLYVNLDDDFEVVFQPTLNGANFDFAILRENGGIVIIEVKDWNLDLYKSLDKDTWLVNSREGKYRVLSPFKQVKEYKDELINFYMENSLEFIAKNRDAYAFIEVCVFFYKASHKEVEQFINQKLPPGTHFLGRDDLENPEILNATFSKYFMKGISKFASTSLYGDACRALKPHNEASIPSKIISYTKKQLDIIGKFRKSDRVRVKGAAGSGKSQVLAKIAIDRMKETNNKVLIVCYNITLRNYYIKLIRRAEPKLKIKVSDIHIQNYHNFIKTQCINLGIPISDTLAFYDQNQSKMFAERLDIPENKKFRYDTILIDEIQDFKPEWVKNLLSFLAPKGKILYCGDIKQDIYQRQDPKMLKTNDVIYTEGCLGRWNELKETFRLPSEMVNFANAYAKEFLPHKNDVDMEENKAAQGILFTEGEITYEAMPALTEKGIYKIIQNIRNSDEYNNETQIGILGLQILDMRHLEVYLKEMSKGNRKLSTTFEPLEMFCYFLEELGFREYANRIMNYDDRVLERNLDKTDSYYLGEASKSFYCKLINYRRAKKQQFYMDNGSYKLSTVHSFKGWELENIILIVNSTFNNNSEEENTHELIYTAITRAKKRLHIVIIDNPELENFCKKYFENRGQMFIT